MAQIQFSSAALAGNDGYFHIRFSEIMRLEGLLPKFPWLPLTILNAREFYDHHFLFHVAMIPFTFGDLILGAKWASVVFASLAFLSVWWLLRSQRIPFSELWALGLLAVSGAFIYRMSMARAQSLSLGILGLSLYFLFSRKHKWLAPLSFLYVWTYDAFPLILIVAGVYVVSVWLINRELDIFPLLYAGAGIALGMLVNPYFPENLIFTFRHLLPKLTGATEIRVGNEWYPYETAQLLENSPLALAAFASGILALGLDKRRMDARTATSLFLALVFGLMLFQARRFVEYFPPFALIFAAFAWTRPISTLSEAGKTGEKRNGHSTLKTGLDQSIRTWFPGILLLLSLIPGMWVTAQNAKEAISDSKPVEYYSSAAAWLEEHTPPGARVFQTDWDDFTRLFYFNTHNTYLVGLDPTYLQLFNESRYETWVNITHGNVENPSETIRVEFGAGHVFSDLNHEDFIDQAEKDPAMVELYRDDDAVIYQLAP